MRQALSLAVFTLLFVLVCATVAAADEPARPAPEKATSKKAADRKPQGEKASVEQAVADERPAKKPPHAASPQKQRDKRDRARKQSRRENRAREELAEIRRVREAFLKAMNAGDVEAAVELWATDGDVANQAGELIRGRKAIGDQLKLLFASPDRPTLVLKPISLRMLAPGVAAEDGLARHRPIPVGPPTKTLYSIIYVKRAGQWLVASVRQAVSYPPSNYAKLAELEWLVGRWRAVHRDEDHQLFEGEFVWTPNKNYILHRFTLHLNNQLVLHGTERIGWDPREQKLKSWIFESDGGVLEGTWTRQEDDGWVIELKGALGDGTPVSGRHEMVRTGENTMRVMLTERTRANQPEADQPPIELERVD